MIRKCAATDCHQAFTRVRCLKRHLSRVHPDFDPKVQQGLPDDTPHSANCSDEEIDYDDIDVQAPIKILDTKTALAKSVLNLRENHKIPYKTCTSFIEITGSIIESHNSAVKKSAEDTLKDNDIPRPIIHAVLSSVDQNGQELSSVLETFGDMNSLNAFVERNMTFVKPISYCLGLNGNYKMQ